MRIVPDAFAGSSMSTVSNPSALPPTPDDQQLMAAYVAGDQRAFGVLFERYAQALQRYFVRHGKARHDAADLVQQTFLNVHRSRNEFRPGEALRPWLFTIARNVRIDHGRRCQRRREVCCDLDRQPSFTTSTDHLHLEERARALASALSALPQEQQALVRERWMKERSWADIASQHGGQVGTLRVRAHRACLQLRDRLDAELAEAA